MASNFQNVEVEHVQYCELCLDLLSETKYLSCPVFCDKCKAGNADLISLMKISENQPGFNMKDLVRYVINITEETDSFKSIKNIDNEYPKNIECKLCNDKSNACSYCTECEDLLCKSCEWAHKRVSLTKHHIILHIAKYPDMRYQENNSLSSIQISSEHSSTLCEEHTNSSEYFYCQECRKPFCKECNIKIHENHSFIRMEEELRHSKTGIIMKLKELKIEIDSIKECENIIKRTLQCINLKAENQSHIIRATFKRYTTALKENERNLLHCIEKIRQIKLSNNQLYKNELIARSVRLKKLLDLKENDSENPGIMTNELLNYFNIIKNSCYNIENMNENDEIIFISPDASLLTAINRSGFVTSNSFPPYCTPSGVGMSRAFCNRVAHFIVHTKNHLGEDMLVGDEDIDAKIQTQSNAISKAHVRDCNNGKYIISYCPEIAGQCLISVRIRDIHIHQSPFNVTVRPYRDYKSLGNILFMFGKEGEKNGEFCNPWGVCCDKDSHIIIADCKNNRIQVFNPDGSFKHKFGSLGSEPGELNRPTGIAVDCQNRIIVADKDNHRIQIFSLEGKFILTFGKYGEEDGMFKYPWDVAVNSECKILVSDSKNHRIQLFDSNGTFLNKYGYEGSLKKYFDSPRGVIFRCEDNVLVTDFNNHRIVYIDPSFEYSRFLGSKGNGARQFFRPQGILVDTEDNIIVADARNHCIKIFNINGKFIHKFGTFGSEPGQMNHPSGICLSPDGLIIVVDCKNNRVQVF